MAAFRNVFIISFYLLTHFFASTALQPEALHLIDPQVFGLAEALSHHNLSPG